MTAVKWGYFSFQWLLISNPPHFQSTWEVENRDALRDESWASDDSWFKACNESSLQYLMGVSFKATSNGHNGHHEQSGLCLRCLLSLLKHIFHLEMSGTSHQTTDLRDVGCKTVIFSRAPAAGCFRTGTDVRGGGAAGGVEFPSCWLVSPKQEK